MFKQGGLLVNHLGWKWSADAVTHLGQKMKHNLHMIGWKAAGSLRTFSDVGNSVLPTVKAIADVTGHPVAGYAVEGIHASLMQLNNMHGKVDYVRNTLH